jgi:hypothetical protein
MRQQIRLIGAREFQVRYAFVIILIDTEHHGVCVIALGTAFAHWVLRIEEG